jgi:hypothetical protein
VSDRIDEHYGFRIHATTLMRWYTAEDIAA